MKKFVLFPLGLIIAVIQCAAISCYAGLSDSQISDFYSYDDQIPLNAQEQLVYEDLFMRQYALSFDAADGESVTGFLTIPKVIWPPNPQFPVIVYLHGHGGSAELDPLLGDLIYFIMLFRETKYAVLSLDARYHGERERPDREIFSTNFLQDRNGLAQTIVDYRRAIDYLETRSNINENQIHLFGISMGGLMGAMLSAVDERVRAASLVVAGGNWTELVSNSNLPPAEPMRQALRGHYGIIPSLFDIVDPVVLAHMISPRYLQMHNGLYDDIVPTGQQLYDAALEPKEIYWYEGDHISILLYTPDILGRTLDMFDQQ